MNIADVASTQDKVVTSLTEVGVPEILAVGIFHILLEKNLIRKGSQTILLLKEDQRVIPDRVPPPNIGPVALNETCLFSSAEQLLSDPALKERYANHLNCRHAARIVRTKG